MSISRVPAARIGVEPVQIRGKEHCGLMFFTWSETPVVGAQCANCNTILWVYQRRNEILNEATPPSVPASGPMYREYAAGKIRRFLAWLPACPQCGLSAFDRYVDNVHYPRFSSGEELGNDVVSADIVKVDAEAVELPLLD